MSLTPRLDKLNAHQNLLINGSFRFWQRGVTAALGVSTYVADRFFAFTDIAGLTGTQTRDASVPTLAESGFVFPYSVKILATAGATAATNAGAALLYRLEGYDYAQIHGGKQVCLQFWVRAKKTGVMGVSFRSGGSDRHYVTSVTIDAVDTWELKRINITTDVVGSWTFDNTVGVSIGFMLDAAGTRLTSTVNQWFGPGVSLQMAPTNQTHFLSSNNDYVQFTGIQLVEGNYDDDIPFAAPKYADELARCQRYYEKSYVLNTNPGTATGTASHYVYAVSIEDLSISEAYFKTPKRSAPTVRVFNTNNGNNNQLSEYTLNPTTFVTNRAIVLSHTTENHFRINGNGQLANGRKYEFHWDADAEL